MWSRFNSPHHLIHLTMIQLLEGRTRSSSKGSDLLLRIGWIGALGDLTAGGHESILTTSGLMDACTRDMMADTQSTHHTTLAKQIPASLSYP